MNDQTMNGKVNDSGAKKLYSSPRLIEHGSVAKLTQGVGGSNVDHGHKSDTRRGGD
jgi:hypothetical protein